ncbi:MAG TPA: preprotein translocase subunit SecG [Bacillota bacterium]|jgi:preprotein translocase subunit SecG|nr:preprotein translocase subunit SecG [Bacillota bacterium]HOA91625.1 preprotein translocase subunit SecG [Bacillota bacterium]HOJ45962.1 preprotein translocase subunit SecG [Bacillota bacterium]HOL13906.1 preprotein translocase subunit SecG [Bacillota bacterium]HOP53349.1 preprotein translocase subunit SecG [Bacillota bacterium]
MRVLTFLTVLDVIVAAVLIVVVALQPSKEAGLGALGGGSQMFANKGGGFEALLDKLTTWFAIAFMVISVLIALIS